MDNSEILAFMHLGGFTVKRPELLVNADKLQIKRDLQAQLPNFVFVYEPGLAKEYLFNFYAYLEYVGCAVYWENEKLDEKILSRAVFLVPSPLMKDPRLDKYRMCRFVPLYPGERGKKAIATQVFGLISGLQKIGHLAEIDVKAPIWLDVPEGVDKWLFNLAGFLSHSGIAVSWGKPSSSKDEDYLFIGHQKPAYGRFIDIGEGDAKDCKLRVFKALLAEGYLQKNNLGFETGPALRELTKESSSTNLTAPQVQISAEPLDRGVSALANESNNQA